MSQSMKYQKWSDEEIVLLREIYEETPREELEKIFNRTWDGIRTKASEIGASKLTTSSDLDLTSSTSLGYILGVLLGDGYIYSNSEKPKYMLGLGVVDEPFCNKLSDEIDEIGLHSSIYKKRQDDCKDGVVYSLECYSKRFVDWYQELDVGEIFDLVSSSQDILYSFLAGLYDSEGSINYRSSNGTVQNIRLSTTDEDMKNLFVDVFDCLGIDSFVYEYEDDGGYTEHGWIVGVSNKKGAKKFFSNIESSIAGKNPEEGTLEYAND